MQRSDAKLDFQPIDEEGRFSFDDYETVAEITFTKAGVELAQHNSERLLSFCFQLTNSIEEGWYEDEGDGEYYAKRIFKSPCRSTSVGDIIQNMDENKYWVVAPVGFNRVFPPVNAYLQMARRRKGLEAESFEAPQAPKWKKIHYGKDKDGDIDYYNTLMLVPFQEDLEERLRDYEGGAEVYGFELSQYLVLEDKVVCFVGYYREMFYNHNKGEYKYANKRNWFGAAYQTDIPYSKLNEKFLEMKRVYEEWDKKNLTLQDLMRKRRELAGGGQIEIGYQKEWNRHYDKKPPHHHSLFDKHMWLIDSKNWRREYQIYDAVVERNKKNDAKEDILEQAQKFVSTEPDWFRNVYVDMAKKRQGLGAEEETPSLEAILDFVYQRFAQGDLEVKHEEIAEHFGMETKEVIGVMREENCSNTYMVGKREWDGNYFMRYKEMPMFAYFSPRYGDKFYSIKNPFVQARAKGRSYDNKDERKRKLRKIMFGADSSFCERCYQHGGIERRTFFKPYSNDEREYEQTFCRYCGDANEAKPIDDKRLEGAKCYMCGKEANYIFEDLPTGAKPFCTEKCLCDYAGFPYMGEGYYGLRPIGGEPFNVKRVLHNTGRLDWRKDFNAPVKKEIGAEGLIYFVLVPFSLVILGSIGLGRILNRRTTENNGDTDGIN